MESVRQNKMVTGSFNPKQGEAVNDFALRILFDDNYHNEVTEIIAPVNLFSRLLINAQVNNLKRHAARPAFGLMQQPFYRLFMA
jgi:methyl-accepting chemotaxis protein